MSLKPDNIIFLKQTTEIDIKFRITKKENKVTRESKLDNISF